MNETTDMFHMKGSIMINSEKTILIRKYGLGFNFKLNANGVLPGTNISCLSILSVFTTYVFDRIRRRMVVGKKYRYYCTETNTLYLPNYYLITFLEFLQTNNLKYNILEIEACEGKDVSIEMIDNFKYKNDRQQNAIEHLISSKKRTKGIALQTGVGKTVSVMAFLANKNKRALIGVVGLSEQWEAAIKQFTKLADDDIFIIKGAPSVIKLLKGIDKTIFPKIIIYSIGTLRNWALDKNQYENFPNFDELISLLDIGVRIIDEGHTNFYINYIMDLRLNVKENIILTATFDVTDPTIKRIFDKHYSGDIRFGARDYKKYVNIFAYNYSTGRGDIPKFAYSTTEGYSHIILEKYLLKRRHKLNWIFTNVWRRIIERHYLNIKNPGEKLLVLCEKVEMCEYLQDKIAEICGDLTTGIYISGTPDSLLVDVDIIISTTKSAGTARDIADLRTMIQTSSIRSSPLNIQNLGRLRELKYKNKEVTPEFIYACNRSIDKQITHHEVRNNIFKSKAKNFNNVNI